MRVVVYGDFNCPYSYLASQRVDRLVAAEVAEVEWRAVEHDPSLSMTGTPSNAERSLWETELTEVAALAMPGETTPTAPPMLISNTHAAVSAYAEAVTDGIADRLRRLLMRTIWERGEHLSSGYDVRRLVTSLTWPQREVAGRLASPDTPNTLDRDPDLVRVVRRSGGIMTRDGEPLTVTAWRRIRQWRTEWLALPSPVVPTIIGPGRVVYPGVEGLRALADLAGIDGVAHRSAATRVDQYRHRSTVRAA